MNLLNKVMIIGNLTADPELRQTGNGTAVADICLAMDGPGAGTDGADDSIFVDVTLWDRLADNAARFLGKGSTVLIEGRLQQDRWEDKKTGQPRRKLRVVGERMRFMGGQRREPEGDERQDRRKDEAEAKAPPRRHGGRPTRTADARG